MEWIHVGGDDAGEIRLYALSTCGHCKRTKEFLGELGVGFNYVNVDLLPEDELREVYEVVKKYNPRGSFPTLVIKDSTVIVGDRLEEIRSALGR